MDSTARLAVKETWLIGVGVLAFSVIGAALCLEAPGWAMHLLTLGVCGGLIYGRQWGLLLALSLLMTSQPLGLLLPNDVPGLGLQAFEWPLLLGGTAAAVMAGTGKEALKQGKAFRPLLAWMAAVTIYWTIRGVADVTPEAISLWRKPLVGWQLVPLALAVWKNPIDQKRMVAGLLALLVPLVLLQLLRITTGLDPVHDLTEGRGGFPTLFQSAGLYRPSAFNGPIAAAAVYLGLWGKVPKTWAWAAVALGLVSLGLDGSRALLVISLMPLLLVHWGSAVGLFFGLGFLPRVQEAVMAVGQGQWPSSIGQRLTEVDPILITLRVQPWVGIGPFELGATLLNHDFGALNLALLFGWPSVGLALCCLGLWLSKVEFFSKGRKKDSSRERIELRTWLGAGVGLLSVHLTTGDLLVTSPALIAVAAFWLTHPYSLTPSQTSTFDAPAHPTASSNATSSR